MQDLARLRAMRVAAADIGTNSTRLLVADVGSDGSVAEVERLLEITRLGEGVDASGTLAEQPMRRVTDTLARFAARARELAAERLLAVATSAVRDAANRDDFLARVAASGFEPRLLSGDAGGGDDVRRRVLARAGRRGRIGRRHARRRRRRGLDRARARRRPTASPGRARCRPAACA